MFEFPKYLLIACNGVGTVSNFNVGKMLNWVIEHDCVDREIMCFDKPQNREIGFRCIGCGEYKIVGVSRIKLEKEYCSEFMNILSSQEIRIKFATGCNEEWKKKNKG